MWTYLHALTEELSRLEKGVMFTDNTGSVFVCRAALLSCTCDLPARWLVTNNKQFNGKFSCWSCLQPGMTSRSGMGHCHVFPYDDDDPKGPPRTTENLKNYINETLAKIQQGEHEYSVHGVKGPFRFLFLSLFPCINGFHLDYMHGVCAGVMKLMLTLWFGEHYEKSCFSAHSYRDLVSKRLQAIKPPLNISRPPRSLEDVHLWKSSEYRNFLLFWGIPVLADVLPNQLFVHFCLFSKGIYLLDKESLTFSEIDRAETCLLTFVKIFADLYDQRFMTMNIHQLVHLSDCVRHNGPLFSNNCFHFEDLNGYIVSHISGTQNVEMQILNTVTLIQMIPLVKATCNIDGEIENAINRLMDPLIRVERMETIDGCFQMGKVTIKDLTNDEFLAAQKIVSVYFERKVASYDKISLRKGYCYVCAANYNKLVRRDQSTIKYLDNSEIQFGKVLKFIQVTDINRKTHNLALLNPMPCVNTYSSDCNVHQVNPSWNKIIAVYISEIVGSCCFVCTTKLSFVCEFPNHYERD
ncbi:uncharacterized protein LOC144753257 isoform X1 [Lissotriton helveticus]